MTVDWLALRTEYVTSRTSMQKLADKYGVSVSSIKRKSVAENWTANRTKIEPKLYQRTVQKVIEKTASQEADRIVRLQAIGDKIAQRIDQAVDEGMDSADLQRLTAALKNLHTILQPPKDDQGASAEGLSIHFESSLKKAAK